MAIKPIEIKGMEACIRKLGKVRETLAAETLRPILLEGAEVFLKESQAIAPVDTGDLKNSLVAKLSSRIRSIVAYFAVDMAKIRKINRRTGKKVRYPYFVEYGRAGVSGVRYFRRAVSRKKMQVKDLIERRLVHLMRAFK